MKEKMFNFAVLKLKSALQKTLLRESKTGHKLGESILKTFIP